ncbi:hypothetical protein D3C73_1366410 [compost metagenome]
MAPGSVQLGLATKAAVGAVSLFSSTRVRPGRTRAMLSPLVATTRSPASNKSASPMATRVFNRWSGDSASTTCEYTAPPFCARPAISSTEQPLPSRCAAIPSNCPMVTTPVPPTPAMKTPYG